MHAKLQERLLTVRRAEADARHAAEIGAVQIEDLQRQLLESHARAEHERVTKEAALQQSLVRVRLHVYLFPMCACRPNAQWRCDMLTDQAGSRHWRLVV